MALRPSATKLIAFALAATLGLTACSDGSDQRSNVSAVIRGDSAEERELRKAAQAMQKTILEGVATGAGVGGTLDLVFGDDDDAGTGITVGAGAGAAAGTYVAHVQQKYTRRARRLRQIQEDLDRNAEEMLTTIAIMKKARDAQKKELEELRAKAVNGEATARQVAREEAEAQDNLKQMNLAIDGAAARQEEFSAARKLTKRRRQEESPIDPDLAQLAGRIAEMKAIANDLATSL